MVQVCGCDVMVAMSVLETDAERRAGSSPVIRTKQATLADVVIAGA